MKHSNFLFLLILLILPNIILSKNSNDTLSNKKFDTFLMIRYPALVFPLSIFAYAVNGTIELNGKGILFSPDTTEGKGIEKLFELNRNNHLIKSFSIDWKTIYKIKRRNTLFILPNRLLIKTKNGKRYLFDLYGRKRKLIKTEFEKHK